MVSKAWRCPAGEGMALEEPGGGCKNLWGDDNRLDLAKEVARKHMRGVIKVLPS